MKPILLHYYVTYRCNVRCEFCNIWDPAVWDHRSMPSWEAMDRNLRSARALGCRFVDFTGGEPLMYADLPRAMRLAKTLGFRTSTTTNCVLYPRRAEELAGEVDLLHFSLDAADRELHDAGRGYACFDKVIESLGLARSLGERPDLLFTATNATYRQIEPLAALAQKHRVMLVVNPEFSYFGNAGLDHSALDYLERFAGKPYVYINHAFHRLIRAGGNDPANPTCRAVEAVIAIAPDDHLLLPCFHQQHDRIRIDGRLAQVRESALVREYQRNDGRHEYCRGCTINCYMDPSFLYRVDAYLLLSLGAKAKYAIDKYFRPLAAA